MPELALYTLILVACLAALPVAADAFLGSMEQIGLRLGIPPFVIGISVVAFGTSAPELLASVFAVLQGSSEIVAGTVIGSNVTNVLLILSVAAMVGRGIRIDHDIVRVDLPFLVGSALLFSLAAYDGRIVRLEALLLLVSLAIYIAYAVAIPETASTLSSLEPDATAPRRITGRMVLAGLGGLAALQLAAWGTVESVVALARLTDVGSDVLAASIVAAGTSLPELVVSVRAVQAGNSELAVGNVMGSNVFNVLGVVGVAALCGTLSVSPQMVGFGLAALLGTTALAFFVLQEREMTVWDGGLLLVLYVAFTLQLFGAHG